MFEIRVALPDVSSANELKSYLNSRDENCSLLASTDGVHAVRVAANGTFPALLHHLRDWIERKGVDTLEIEVDGTPYTIER